MGFLSISIIISGDFTMSFFAIAVQNVNFIDGEFDAQNVMLFSVILFFQV
jgi:hypothetical protein